VPRSAGAQKVCARVAWQATARGRSTRALGSMITRHIAGWRALIVPNILALAACSPYVTAYKHVVFDAGSGLEVLERSHSSVDSQGKPLKFGRSGVPLKVRLTRDTYVIEIDMPQGSAPVVFLRARTPTGTSLTISGASIQRVAPGSASELEGYPYSFYVAAAEGMPLEFTISLENAAPLGTERLEYVVQTYGYACGIETI
jgi:hypothetical protein